MVFFHFNNKVCKNTNRVKLPFCSACMILYVTVKKSAEAEQTRAERPIKHQTCKSYGMI